MKEVITWQQEIDLRRARERSADDAVFREALRLTPVPNQIGMLFIFPDRSNRWPPEVITAIERAK
jgi:hypothetical protein